MLHFGKGAVKAFEVALQSVQAVEVERGPHLAGNGLDGEFFTEELFPLILKIVHLPSSNEIVLNLGSSPD
jgi:hypothetical protein